MASATVKRLAALESHVLSMHGVIGAYDRALAAQAVMLEEQRKALAYVMHHVRLQRTVGSPFDLTPQVEERSLFDCYIQDHADAENHNAAVAAAPPPPATRG